MLDPDVFPPPAGAHPLRWWWKARLGARWVRDDGVEHADDSVAFTTRPEGWEERLEAELAAIDAARPMACPQPRVGMIIQIMVAPTMTTVTMVSSISVDIRGKVRGVRLADFGEPLPCWPPPPGSVILGPTPWSAPPVPRVMRPVVM